MERIDPEDLYDERRDVAWHRPILQGDVFEGVVLPGFGDEPRIVQVVTHPCAMRRGPQLHPRITVAPTETHQRVEGSGWDGNLRVMPLAELLGERRGNYASKFVDVTAASSESLTLERRVATLSQRGIYVLQQRLIKHYTRVEVPLEVLRKESAPVLVEAEMQRVWTETVLDDLERPETVALARAVESFDRWLSEGSPSRRELLKDESYHSDLRRKAGRAAEALRKQFNEDSTA